MVQRDRPLQLLLEVGDLVSGGQVEQCGQYFFGLPGVYEGEGRNVQQMSYYPLAAFFVDDHLVVAITNDTRAEFLTCYHEHFSKAHGVEPPASSSVAQKQLRYKQKLKWDEQGGMIRNLKRIKNV